MNKTAAGSAFFGLGAVPAYPLIAWVIPPGLSGGIFAAALITCGFLSRGFTGRKRPKNKR